MLYYVENTNSLTLSLSVIFFKHCKPPPTYVIIYISEKGEIHCKTNLQLVSARTSLKNTEYKCLYYSSDKKGYL